MADSTLVVRKDREWEQIAFAEVLVPNVPNTYGDIYTPEAIVEFAYEFARQGYGLDVDHDNQDVSGSGYYVVESFIAREGDPDFIPGSWVVGIKVADAELWQRILNGEINGFSYEALVEMIPVDIDGSEVHQVSGTTSPHPEDGHTHTYLLLVDGMGNHRASATSETNGHSHRILNHTVTEVAEGHNHRIQVVQ